MLLQQRVRELMMTADGRRNDPRHRRNLFPTGKAEAILPRGRGHDSEHQPTKRQPGNVGMAELAVIKTRIQHAVPHLIECGAGHTLMQFHFQQRMAGEGDADEFTDAGQFRVAQGADACFAHELAFERERHILHIAHGGQNFFSFGEQSGPGGSQHHSRGGAFEQLQAELVLKRFELCGNGRLAHVQLFGRAGELP